jgi:diguanylate cyclase
VKLLLVDDDLVDRMATQRLLKKSELELEITIAANGYQAISEMQANEFDLVLLDYNLPDLSGLEVLQHVKVGGIGKTAIIFLSGEENETLAQQCLELGAQDFLLKKEVSPAHLHKAITHSKLRHENEIQLDKNRQKMQNLAEHDQLTGLLNRYAFESRIAETKALRERLNANLSLMLLDLDNFKWINDTHGHDQGDIVLIEVAKRLESVCRNEDFLCRLGGDEFAIAICCQENDYSHIIAERIFSALSKPLQLMSFQVNIECSIGIADFTDKRDELNDVLKKADLAMYRAKADGRNRYHFFDDTLQEVAERRGLIATELRQAIQNDEFVVYYQPQICAETLRLIGAEALIRWDHPKRGILGPHEFLDIAEETGLIDKIDQIVMAKACRQRILWQNSIAPSNDFKVAINISAHHLTSYKFIDNIKRVMDDVNIDPNLIELEIVESELVQDFAKAVEVISQLKTLGINMSIDDFGTGYSSLSYLKHLKVQTLKVDRSFLNDVPYNEVDCRLLKGVINLGQSMKLKVIIEGTENLEQLLQCQEYNADIIQGFYFSKPLSVTDFEQFHEQHLEDLKIK